MKIMVTGLAGFTGHYVANILQDRNREVVGFKADLRDADALSQEVASVRPDALIHLAAIAFAGTSDVDPYYQVNLLGTLRLVERFARYAPEARIIIASTAAFYDGNSVGAISEDAPTRPTNHYANSKLAMEAALNFWRDRLDFTIVRPFNYTGVGQPERYLVPKIVDHYRRRAPEIELGNLDVYRDFGDVRHVSRAYCDLIDVQPTEPVLNIATARALSVRDILSIATRVTGHAPEISVNTSFVRTGEVDVQTGDNARLRAALPDWSPIAFEDTIAWMLAANEVRGAK